MDSPNANIGLDSKIGAAFLGTTIAAILYGITCVQTFVYYKYNDKNHSTLRALVFILWILDTMHMAFITHALYYYLVSNYGNISSIASPTWSILSQIYVTIISGIIIRGIFGRRVWLLSGRKNLLAIYIALASAATFVPSFAFATKAFALSTFESLDHIIYLFYIGFGCSITADALITSSLCYILYNSRTGFRKTDSLVNTLMKYAINTTLLTTVADSATFVTYAVWPREYTFMGIYFCLSKLYLNSLLATLNSREALSEKITGITDISMPDIMSRLEPLITNSGSREPPAEFMLTNK